MSDFVALEMSLLTADWSSFQFEVSYAEQNLLLSASYYGDEHRKKLTYLHATLNPQTVGTN